MPRTSIFISLMFLLLIRSTARADDAAPAGLSLRDAIDYSLKHNPRLSVARHRVAAHQGQVLSAKAPSALALQAVPFGTFNDNPLVLSQTLEVVGKRDLRARSARSELSAAEFDLQTTTLAVTHDVTIAYVALQEAIARRASVEHSAQLMETLRTLTQQRFELGDAPKVHVTRVEIELDRARQTLTEATVLVAVKATALNAQLGREATTPVEPAEALTLEAGSPPDLASPRTAALESRPDLRAARALAAARQSDVKLTQRSALPDFVVQARFGDRLGGAGTQVGFGVSLPLFAWGGIRGQTKTARANAAVQAALVDRAQLEAGAEIAIAARRLIAARAVAESYTQRIVPNAESLARTLRLSYAQGGTTFIEVIDAQRTLAATQIEKTRALADYHTALAELNRALGRQLPRS